MIQHKYPDGPSDSHRPLRSIIIELCELDGRFHYALYWSTKRTFGCILREKSRLSNLGLGDDAILPTFHYPAFLRENMQPSLEGAIHYAIMALRRQGVRCPIFDRLHS